MLLVFKQMANLNNKCVIDQNSEWSMNSVSDMQHNYSTFVLLSFVLLNYC